MDIGVLVVELTDFCERGGGRLGVTACDGIAGTPVLPGEVGARRRFLACKLRRDLVAADE